MDKNRKNRKFSNWNNQKKENKNNENNKQRSFQFNHNNYENDNDLKEKQKAIQEIKARQIVCPKCNQPITDIASAFRDKNSEAPIHFECAMEEVSKNEKLNQNEKIAYIGQGRFGILYYENPRDQKHFKIKKIIEWEEREQKSPWRDELSELYSKVK
ncbi:MAG: hypothetical protein MJ174_05035 [Treponema sp.]|nr:hypothetical protein [Treponema sp.]